MSDPKEEEKQEEKKVAGGGTLKLQLNRPLDTLRLKGGVTSPKSSKTVTVEVRKTRGVGATRQEAGEAQPEQEAPLEKPQVKTVSREIEKGGKPAPERLLTQEERTHRLQAIKLAKVAAEEEAKKEAERVKVAETRKRELEEQKREEEERRLEEKRAEELRKQKLKASKKKKVEEVDLTAEFISQKEKKKSPSVQVNYDFEEEAAAQNKPDEQILESEDDKELIISKSSAYLDTAVELEDYSEDVEVDDEPQILNIKTDIDPSKKLSVVRPVKGSDRIIMATADREKLKKNLRSEAVVQHKSKARYEEPRKNSVRAVLSQFTEQQEERARSIASMRRQREKIRARTISYAGREPDKVFREVVLPEAISVQDLAARMSEKVTDVIKTLLKMGVTASAAETIDADTAELVIAEFGHTVKRVSESDVENVLHAEVEDEGELRTRPPVVTVMGHVDHGKTTLLDSLRQTDVVAGEAGGITQHIGAYQVELEDGRKITFIDTPGHAAFTSMRARGAKVTDIVILVVAADDGIKEQTVEAINHAKAAEVPIIVAINKIDKPDADPSKAKNELFAHGLVPEEFGGDVMVVEVSAKAKLNLDKLKEAILLQAEVLDLKANPNRKAHGTVIEAKVDKGRGVVATVLVQKGTLKVGDIVVAGTSMGRVRSIIDDKGRQLKEAAPSVAAELLGLDAVPAAGDEFSAVADEKTAREIADYRKKLIKDKTAAASAKMGLEEFLKVGGVEKQKELNILVKGDVHGSVEAISAALEKIVTDEAKVRVLHSGVGAITESDIALAKASNAIVIGFNVRASSHAKDDAAKEGIEIRYYSIIYELIDEVKKALAGILSPKEQEKFIGYAEIRQVFEISKLGKIAGCMVTQGFIKRGSKVRLLRDNVVIHEGWLKTLRRFKDDVKEVKEGFECGMSFENYDDIREGDVIEASEIEQIAATVE